MKSFHWKSSIYYRLIVFFVSVGIIPLLLLTFMSYWQMQSAIYSKVNSYSSELMQVIGRDMDRELQQLENILIDISYSDDVQNLYQNYGFLSPQSVLLQRSSIRMDIAIKISTLREVTDIYAYFPNKDRVVLYGDEGYKFALQEEFEEKFFDDIYNGNGKTVMYGYSEKHQQNNIRLQQDIKKGTEKCILLGREVRSLETNGTAGVIIMRVSESLLSDKLRDINSEANGQMVVMGESGRIMASTDPENWAVGSIVDEDLRLQLLPHSTGYEKIQVHDQEYMIVSAKMESRNWEVIYFIPCEYLDRETYTMSKSSLLLLFAIVVLIAVAMKCFSKSISYPLTQLVNAMHKAENGNLDTKINNDSPDEIGQVTRSFNKMLEKLQNLLEDVKHKEKEKRKMELDALQAQINPHFLSNTLNIAKYLAHSQKADNIEELMVALIELMHVTMNRSQDLITIKDEICCLKSYVEIMRFRDYSSFEILYEVQPDLADSLIPKLILQPIVENSLLHGIHNKTGHGRVIVRVTGDETEIHISVTDNGRGIPPEEISTLLTTKKEHAHSSFSSIGLANVNGRIQLLFGEKYGLYIQSVYQMYTTVEIVIPNWKRGENAGETKDIDSR